MTSWQFMYNTSSTYIAYDRYLCDRIKNIEPNSNVLSTVGNWSTNFAHEFIRVDPDFKNVICESEKWC